MSAADKFYMFLNNDLVKQIGKDVLQYGVDKLRHQIKDKDIHDVLSQSFSKSHSTGHLNKSPLKWGTFYNSPD
jgi:hypothetical protein